MCWLLQPTTSYRRRTSPNNTLDHAFFLLQRSKNLFADRERVAQCKEGHKDRVWWSKGTLQLSRQIPHMLSGLTFILHLRCVGVRGQPAVT